MLSTIILECNTCNTPTLVAIVALFVLGDGSTHTEGSVPVNAEMEMSGPANEEATSFLVNNPSGDSTPAGKANDETYLLAVLLAWHCAMEKCIFTKDIHSIQCKLNEMRSVNELCCTKFILHAEMAVNPEIVSSMQSDTRDTNLTDEIEYIRTIQMCDQQLENARSSVNFTNVTSPNDPQQVGHLRVVMPSKDIVYVKVQDSTVSYYIIYFS